MNAHIIKEIWRVLTGQLTAVEIEGFKKAISDAVIPSLKGFAIPYDSLTFWVNNRKYVKVLEETRPYLLKQLYTQGGLSQYLAQHLELDDINISIGVPSSDAEASLLASPNLPSDCSIWFALSMTEDAPMPLEIKGAGIDIQPLDPSNRNGYTIGRGTESGNMSEMITIPDDTNTISRNQVEIFCEQGKWYCRALSENCRTSFVHKTGDLCKPGEKGLLVDSKRPQNRIEFSNCGKSIVLQCRLLSENQ